MENNEKSPKKSPENPEKQPGTGILRFKIQNLLISSTAPISIKTLRASHPDLFPSLAFKTIKTILMEISTEPPTGYTLVKTNARVGEKRVNEARYKLVKIK